MQRLITLISSGALAALAAGCGDSGKFDRYLGNWRYDQVQAPLNCGDAGSGDAAPLGNKVFADSLSHAIVEVSVTSVDGLTSCNFEYDVSGMNANMVPNQVCTLTQGATLQPSTWRFTLLGPNQAEEVGSAFVNDVPTGTGTTANCDVSFQARLTRVAAD
jgi:hypothetical protein